MPPTAMQQTILQEFESLIYEGNSYAARHKTTDTYGQDDRDYLRLRTRALNLVQRVCGKESEHYQELHRLAVGKGTATNNYYFSLCLGALEAARDDYQRGLLFDLRALIEAEVLGDFIDQAEMLLSQGYYIPAASLAGAVLEDSLRKLYAAHGIPIPTKTSINVLNIELVKKNVYNALVQKYITALADIRNNADHGHTNKFNRQDVEDMIRYIRRFTADYLS